MKIALIILTTPFVLLWFCLLAVSPLLPFLVPSLPHPYDYTLAAGLVALLIGAVVMQRIEVLHRKEQA